MSDRYIVHVEDLYKFAVDNNVFDFDGWGYDEDDPETPGYNFFLGNLEELRPALRSYFKFQCGFWLDPETKTITFNTAGLELASHLTGIFFHEYESWGMMNFSQRAGDNWMMGVDDPCHSIWELFDLGSDGDVDYCSGHPECVFQICEAWAKAHKDQGNDPHVDDWKKEGYKRTPYQPPADYPTGGKLQFFLYSDECALLRKSLDLLYLQKEGPHREKVAAARVARGLS